MNLEYFSLAAHNLGNRKKRSLLTIIGIFIGIAAVVALLSLSEGLENAVVGEFEKMGSDKITIMPGAGVMAAFSSMSGGGLTEDDVRVVKKTRGVKLAGGILMQTGNVEFKKKKEMTFVIGMPTDDTQRIMEDMQQFELDKGRRLRATDRRKALIGSWFSDGLFDKKVDIGDVVKIDEEAIQVVGVLKSVGNRMDDSMIVITMEDAREFFDEPEVVSVIYAQTDKGAEPAKVAERIEEKLRKSRHEEEGEETFSVSTAEQMLQSFSMILGVLEAVVVGIAAISLLVGGIGIMNTMYTSVIERTKEIGIMKAVGARNSDILSIFLIESGMLGIVGGVVGVIIGYSLSKTAELIAVQAAGINMLKVSFSLELVVGALLFSFLLGSLSGLLPAKQAASLKPVDALRYE